MLTGLHAGPTRSVYGAEPAAGLGHWLLDNCLHLLPVILLLPALRGEPGEVGSGRNETCPFFRQNNLQIGLIVHDHIYSMSAHAIHALFTFYLAAFSRYVDTIENLDFQVLLRVTRGELASPFLHQILEQQMLM